MTNNANSNAIVAADSGSSTRVNLMLFLLLLVYILNFLDRQILSILAPAIQKELGISDGNLGLLRGLSFALFYSILGVPIAYFADRKSRTWIITIALTLWSAMTAVCGLATNFWQLFLARMGVGIGEAGGVAPSYSLIADYFEPSKRARAMAIFSFGVPLGSAIGVIFGAVIVTILDWRAAFIIMGAIGLVLAPIFRIFMREPVRGGRDSAAATEAVSVKVVLKTLATKPSFWTLTLGAASSSMIGYGLLAWLPAFYLRSYGNEMVDFMSWLPSFLVPKNAGPILYIGYFQGLILLIGGVSGMWLGGLVTDKMGAKSKSAYARVPAIAFLAIVPFYLIGIQSHSLALTFVMFLIPTGLGLVWMGPVLAAFQHIVKPNMRTTASAIFLLINNLIGIGVGDWALGGLSDVLKERYAEESLRYSIMFGSSLYLVAAVFMLIAANQLSKDWED